MKKKKRDPAEEVVEVTKKKKRSPERAKAKLEKRKAKLNAALEDIGIDKIRRSVRPGEREYLEEYVWMFNRIGRLIRATENRALKSGQSRDIYALSTLISQQREIIADIRTLADTSGQSDALKTAVLRPLVSDVAQNLLDSYYQLRRLIVETVKPKETQFALAKLEEIVKDMSKFLQVKYHEASEKSVRVLTGEEIAQSDDKPKKRKKKKAQ